MRVGQERHSACRILRQLLNVSQKVDTKMSLTLANSWDNTVVIGYCDLYTVFCRTRIVSRKCHIRTRIVSQYPGSTVMKCVPALNTFLQVIYDLDTALSLGFSLFRLILP